MLVKTPNEKRHLTAEFYPPLSRLNVRMVIDEPVNPVTRFEPNTSFSDAALLIIEDCVVCGDSHTHGLPNYSDRLEVGYTAEKVAQCTDGAGYTVEVTEDTEINV